MAVVGISYPAKTYQPNEASVRTMQQAIDLIRNPTNTNTPNGTYPENGWRTAPYGGNVVNAT
jgi:hypothetical protein